VFENWSVEASVQPLALRIALRLGTLGAIAAAWIPFRAVSLEQAITMLETMFGRFSLGISYSVNFYLMVLFWCAWVAFEPSFGKLLARMGEPDRPSFFGAVNGYFCARSATRFSFYYFLLLMIVIYSCSTSSSDLQNKLVS
jgi:hypothetical protein